MFIKIGRAIKKIGLDFTFDDFISLLKKNKVLLNYENSEIIDALKAYSFDYFSRAEGEFKKINCSREVVSKIPFIKHQPNSIIGLVERGFDEIYAKQKINESNRLKIEYWVKKGFSEDDALLKLKEIQRKASNSIKTRNGLKKVDIEKKIGKAEADLFFKRKSRYCIEYWLSRGFSIDYAIEQIRKIQVENSKKLQIDKQKNPEKYKLLNKKNILYWISRGYTENEAKAQISEIQKTFTLQKCIEKYGKEDGYKRWHKRQENGKIL